MILIGLQKAFIALEHESNQCCYLFYIPRGLILPLLGNRVLVDGCPFPKMAISTLVTY